MKVLKVTLSPSKETALLKEAKGTFVDKDLLTCIGGHYPWVAPCPYESFGTEYCGPTPLAQFREWHGRPWIEASSALGDTDMYATGIPEPQRTAKAILRALLDDNVRLFFVNPDNLGILVSSLTQISEEWRKMALAHKIVVLPDTAWDHIVQQHTGICDFGWRENHRVRSRDPSQTRRVRCYKPYKYIEFRYWADPGILNQMANYDGRAVVKIHPAHELSKPYGEVVLAEGFAPVKCGRDLSDLETGFYFAMPVTSSRAYKTLPTSLVGLDEVLIPRGGIRGKITASVIGSFVKGKLGKKAGTIAETAEALGEYYEQIEPELVRALEPPKMVVAQRNKSRVLSKFMSDDRKVPEAAALVGVQNVLGQVYDPGSHASVWVINMLCRVAVVMHAKHTVIFREEYKTDLYTAKDIITAIMKAGAREKSPYLDRMVLVSGLKDSPIMREIREMKPEEIQETSAPLAGLGTKSNDFFS